MIVGRAAEMSTLDRLLAGVERRAGGSIFVHGEPGIGKTTLLDALVERCAGNVRVLRGRGLPSEVELPFSVLRDVLQPVLGELDGLPQPQAAALAGALALGPPVPGERLSVCVAALGVVQAAASHGPVLVVIDDLQWLDASSRECLQYVARRSGGGLGVVLAARQAGHEIGDAGMSVLSVGPLDDRSAGDLLRHCHPGLAPAVTATITKVAAGNPLALVELPRAMSDEERAGRTQLTLPLIPEGHLQRAFSIRLEALGQLARRALLIAAADQDGDLMVIAAACRTAGTDAALLADAEALRLVTIQPQRVIFAHPLVRGAVYGQAAGPDRRAAHLALATALPDDREVWHLAAAAVGPDEHVAARLERIATEAVARRAFAPASSAFERAANLTTATDDACRRVLAAGQAAGAAGDADRALGLLDRAARTASSPQVQARAVHLRGRLLVWRGQGEEAMRVLTTEAAKAASWDRGLAATMLADAAAGATTVNAYLKAEELASQAVNLLEDDTPAATRAPVLAAFAYVLALRGQAMEARPAWCEATRLADGLDGLGSDWPWMHLLLRTLVPLGELEQALSESLALERRARAAGSLATLTGALLVAADSAFRLGDWDSAEDRALETIRIAADTRQPALRGFALSTHARLLAARGRADESRRTALEALAMAQSAGISSGLRFVHASLAFLELSLDRVDAAIEELETVQRLLENTGLQEPTIVPWAPDLIEAYVRCGRVTDARRLLATLHTQAERADSAVARAAVARCRGLLDDSFDESFQAALALHARRPMPFERARTLLAYGQRLHRDKRRGEAREVPRESLAGFKRLGADAWGVQAEGELRAAGARRRQRVSGDALTAQELRVVDAVRRGMTNREVATKLFLSPRTVDFHLQQIYRKIGVRSRTQLIAAVSPEIPQSGSRDLHVSRRTGSKRTRHPSPS